MIDELKSLDSIDKAEKLLEIFKDFINSEFPNIYDLNIEKINNSEFALNAKLKSKIEFVEVEIHVD